LTYKRLYFFLIFFIFFLNNTLAEDKDNIIKNLENLKTLKFSFLQITNENSDVGVCFLEFPGKLKCNYKDNKQKELLVNDKSLYITQKRYNKTLYYPLSKSPYSKILNKKELIKIIKKSKIEYLNDQIRLIDNKDNKQEITIFFDKNDLILKGWKIEDHFKNKITFLIDIISINENISPDKFKKPTLN